MRRNLFAMATGLALLPPAVFAAGFQPIFGVPGSYTPGQPVSFDVRLPTISNLGSYNIDLVLESIAGKAGTDFFFDVAATMPASANYVFPSKTNFFDAATVDSSTRHRITLTDFDLVGANISPGMNDRIARVLFQTAATFRGRLKLFVDAPLLILDTPNVVPAPVMDFAAIQRDIALTPPVELPLVPEPTSIAELLAALAVMLVSRKESRRI